MCGREKKHRPASYQACFVPTGLGLDMKTRPRVGVGIEPNNYLRSRFAASETEPARRAVEISSRPFEQGLGELINLQGLE